MPGHASNAAERLAEIAHDLWRDCMEAEGWRYGPGYDPGRRTHDALVPFRRLDQHDRRQALLGIAALQIEDELRGSVWYERGPDRLLTLEEMSEGLRVASSPWSTGHPTHEETGEVREAGEIGEVGQVIAWDTDDQGWLCSVTVRWPDGSTSTHHPADRELTRAPTRGAGC